MSSTPGLQCCNGSSRRNYTGATAWCGLVPPRSWLRGDTPRRKDSEQAENTVSVSVMETGANGGCSGPAAGGEPLMTEGER